MSIHCVDGGENSKEQARAVMAEEGCELETALPTAMNTSAFCQQPFIGLDYFLGRRTWEALKVSTANIIFFFLRCLCLFMHTPAHQ